MFVGNLPPDFPDERLAETFDPYGIVLSAVGGARPRHRRAAALRVCRHRDREGRNAGDHRPRRHRNRRLQAQRQGEREEKREGRRQGKRREAAECRTGAAPRLPRGTTAAHPDRRGRSAAATLPRAACRNGRRAGAVRQAPAAGPRPDTSADVPQGLDRPARPAQSSIIAAELGEMEPPPRRDFEVVHKPTRRRTTPSFQVERRALPRRGQS